MTTVNDLPTITHYYPEMGEKRPEATQVRAQLGHYGKHYYIDVAPGLPRLSGRGIEFIRVLTADMLVPGSKLVGWTNYKVTVKAMKRISETYRVSSEALL